MKLEGAAFPVRRLVGMDRAVREVDVEFVKVLPVADGFAEVGSRDGVSRGGREAAGGGSIWRVLVEAHGKWVIHW